MRPLPPRAGKSGDRSAVVHAQYSRGRMPDLEEDVEILTRFFRLNGSGALSHAAALRLVRRAGGLARVLAMAPTALRNLGVSEGEIAALRLLAEAIRVTLRRRAEDRPLLANLRAVLDYLHADQAFRPVECVRGLFLASSLHLVHDSIMTVGSLRAAPVSAREIAARAVEVRASSVILVHNHPSGVAAPSREDVQATWRLKGALAQLEIDLLDHIVIAEFGFSSILHGK